MQPHNSHSLPNITRIIKSGTRWPGRVERMGEINVCKILVRKLEGKRQLGITKRRWENNTDIH
jgi:hypothetical protein